MDIDIQFTTLDAKAIVAIEAFSRIIRDVEHTPEQRMTYNLYSDCPFSQATEWTQSMALLQNRPWTRYTPFPQKLGGPMQNKRLGNSDMFLSPLGIGAWAIGGADWAFSWSAQDDGDSVRAIHAALDAGMNWIDTAAVYGLGHSEEVVAMAIKSYSGKRPLVFTKCGRNWNRERQIQKDLRASSIRQECEDSLRRLQVETIDLYQIHWPEPDESVEEGWGTLAALQREGKVRWIGVSNFNVSQLERVQKIATVTSLQPPYSLVRPEVETAILPFALEQQIGVLAYSPMGSGLLTGAMSRERIAKLPSDDWRIRNANFQEPLLTRNLKIAEKLVEIGARQDRTAGEIALAWVLNHPAITAAIVGIRTPEQVAGISGALEFRLSASELNEIECFRQSNND